MVRTAFTNMGSMLDAKSTVDTVPASSGMFISPSYESGALRRVGQMTHSVGWGMGINAHAREVIEHPGKTPQDVREHREKSCGM
ncbi:hypothetical protein StoSoilB5_35280 [Arthrobacter sp. StoSoilB5]|nr:hypothetical protein StoSoilB5_35280 [Arthrobacter sp. StoSoilB5]